MGAPDIDVWIEKTRKCELLPERDLKHLCLYVQEVLLDESTCQPVAAPCTICGDIHGQFRDLLELFRTGGECPSTRYVFMGDFVDRGHNSVETMILLLLLKARWPHHIYLLRGNHESRQVTQVYGFYDECMRKYGNGNPWRYCTDLFDAMPLAALVEGRVLCVHGGLSPDVRTCDHMRMIDRKMEIPQEGPFADLMWSDPDDIDTWSISPRGAGWLFGAAVTHDFNETNGVELICRAHQLVQEGYKYMFSDQLVTVWSCPNYCYRCGNVAAILQLDENLKREWLVFREVDENDEPLKPGSAPGAYFM